jgi:phosphatidylglycerophosphatase A
VILLFAPETWVLYLALTLLITALAVPICTAAEGVFGHDGREIVLDEWAGMFLCLLFLPRTLPVVASAFVLFRVLDILKPFPAGRAQNLPGGWGVVADDVVAGIYTCIVLHVSIRIDALSRYLV